MSYTYSTLVSNENLISYILMLSENTATWTWIFKIPAGPPQLNVIFDNGSYIHIPEQLVVTRLWHTFSHMHNVKTGRVVQDNLFWPIKYIIYTQETFTKSMIWQMII